MINSEKYQSILVERVIPELKKWWPNGEEVFQQDLAILRKKTNITILDWPENSRGIKAIEYLWTICKIRLSISDYTTVENLITAIINI